MHKLSRKIFDNKWLGFVLLLSTLLMLISPMRAFADISLFEGDKTLVAIAGNYPALVDGDPDFIDGINWEIGTLVTLEIDDPSTPIIDYSDSQLAHENENLPSETTLRFWLGEFDLQPGHVVTMYDDEVITTHIVRSLTITEIDVDADIIRGSADPYSPVIVNVDLPEFHSISATADEGGYWSVNFSGITDIDYGSGGGAMSNTDENMNTTRFNFQLKPTLEASITDDFIYFSNFSPSETITLEIKDAPGGTLIYEDVLAVDWKGTAFLDLWEILDINPGVYIWAHDDATNLVKDLVLADLTVDTWDIEEGLVQGTSDPDQGVQVIIGPEEQTMDVFADGDGNWIADFTGSFTEDNSPMARIFDEERDATTAGYEYQALAEEHIVAHAQYDPTIQDWHRDQIDGLNWEIGTWVNLEINDPSNGPGIDYNDGQEAHITEAGEVTVSFVLEYFDLQPGHQITMYNEEITKTHVVQSQVITEINVDTEVIAGNAEPGTEVMVWVENPEWHEIIVPANEFGHWSADFSGFADIGYGTWGAAAVNGPEQDASHTRYNYDFSHTHLEATMTYEHIGFFNFTPSNTIALEIYDALGGNLVYEDVLVTDIRGFVSLELYEIQDLYPGIYIWAHDDATNLVKDLELRFLTLDTWDPEIGLVQGAADPFEEVQVNIYPDDLEMVVSADGDGNWEANYGQGFPEESWPAVRIYDEDRDESVADIEYHEPPFIVGGLVHDHISLQGFEPLTNVTLTINGETFNVTTYENGSYEMERYEHMIPLEPGTIITASQGDVYKELTLQDISVTGIDYDADVVMGTAPEGFELEIGVYNEAIGEGFGMLVVSGPGDIWEADFSDDITEEMWVGANHYDDDKDISVAELPPVPFFFALTDSDMVIANDYQIGVELRLTIVDQSNNLLHEETKITEPLFDPFYGFAIFELGFDLVPGHFVTMEGGGYTKTHTVIAFDVTSIDLVADTISGTAPPGMVVSVGIAGSDVEIFRWVEADPSGYWIADLSVPGPNKGEENIWDLQVGDHGFVQVADSDGDATGIEWIYQLHINAIQAPEDPIPVGTEVNVSATFTDPGLSDTHYSLWDWGDESSSEGLVEELTTYGTHTYDTPGIYTLRVEVWNDEGGWDDEIFQYIVVYDPEGGFVTGGGWFFSPAGAYVDDPTLVGKVSFGFVSKYKKEVYVPIGQTEFHFMLADLKFKSDSYKWLVIAGNKAMYTGEGSINGSGEYGFMITCSDGDLEGEDGIDRFRIVIWDKATGLIVYDNQLGEVDSIEPTTELGGGSIVIHREKNHK